MKRRPAAIAIIAVLLAGGCGDGTDERFGDAADAAVGVRASGCGLVDRLGTGALIAADDRDVIVTSAHTVAGAATIIVEGPGVEAEREASEVELLAIDPTLDLAVLRAPPWATTGRDLADPIAGESGRLAIWAPDDGISTAETEITRLLRVTIEDIYVQGEHERRAFEIDASIARGDSGSPVIGDGGQVYGVVYARSRDRGGVAFAVSATEIGPVIAAAGDAPVDSGRCV